MQILCMMLYTLFICCFDMLMLFFILHILHMYHIPYCYISKYVCIYIYMPKLLPIHAYIYTHCLYVHVYDDMCRVLLLHDSCTFYICMIFHFATFANLCIYIYICVCIIFHIATFTNLYILYIYICLNIYLYVHIYIYTLFVCTCI